MAVIAVLVLIVVCMALIGGGAKMGLLIIPAAAVVWIASGDKHGKGVDGFFAAALAFIVIGGIIALALALFR